MRAKLLPFAVAGLTAACTEALPTVPPPAALSEQWETIRLEVPARLSNSARDTVFVTIDGVPTLLVNGRSQPLDPNDIETIEVVKGASARTLYGAGTHCPAIIVRTRRP
jgi:hypothetical protein